MPHEKLSDTDINRLKGVIGLGAKNNTKPQNTSTDIPEETGNILTRPLEKHHDNQPVNNLVESEHTKQKFENNKDTELFVKIDEHTTVAKELVEAKGDIKYLADTIALLGKAETLKAQAIDNLEHHLDKLDTKLEDVEKMLIAPEGIDLPDTGVDIGLSSDISNLHNTLERLKDELSHSK